MSVATMHHLLRVPRKDLHTAGSATICQHPNLRKNTASLVTIMKTTQFLHSLPLTTPVQC